MDPLMGSVVPNIWLLDHNSISITWELVRNAHSPATLDLLVTTSALGVETSNLCLIKS